MPSTTPHRASKSQKAFQPIPSSTDEIHFQALRVSLPSPSTYPTHTLLTNHTSITSSIPLSTPTPGLHYLHPCLPPNRNPSPGASVIVWELKQPKYQHWRGKYAVWFWKGREEFWVCRLGEEKWDAGERKRVVGYDSVPVLDRRCRNQGIAEWLGHVAAYLKSFEGM